MQIQFLVSVLTKKNSNIFFPDIWWSLVSFLGCYYSLFFILKFDCDFIILCCVFSFFIIGEICVIYFDHFHTPPPRFTIFLYYPSLYLFKLSALKAQFVLPICFWECDHPLVHGQLIRGHILKEADSLFSSSYQLSTES